MIQATDKTAGLPQLAMGTERWRADHLLVREHGMLVRQLASLQRRWSEQWAEQTARERRLDAEVVRLRGRLLQARTALLWGLGAVPGDAALHNRSPAQGQALPAVGRSASAFREVAAVLCQTACTGHAHPWRTAEGLCQRTGDACRTDTGMRSGVGAPEAHGPDRCEALPDRSPSASKRT